NDPSNVYISNNNITFNSNKYDVGGERIAYYGTNLSTGCEIVVKEYRDDKNNLARYKATVLTTLVSQYFANLFNNTGVTSRKISFKNIYLLNYNNYLYFLESKLENFLKFNSNNGWQNSDEKCKTLDAFTHISYKYSSQ